MGDFELVDQVARGGSGDVWQATQRADELQVALKFFDQPDAAAAEGDRIQRAQGTPGIVELVARGSGWLATTWVEGRTLSHLIETEGPLPPQRALRLLNQLGETLDELAARDIAHGDLSPSNVLVDLHDRTTLIDLGVAAPDADGPLNKTTRIDLHSTPRYTAPELAMGTAPEPAGDQYSLALIGFEALSGRSPFPDSSSIREMLDHQRTTLPMPLSEAAPHLGTSYDSALATALSKTPGERYPSATDFVTELAGEASQRPVASMVESERSSLWRWLLPAAVVAAVVGGVFVIAGRDSSAPVSLSQGFEDRGWVAGAAASSTCNLVDVPGFEQGQLPENWYGGANPPALALVEGAGVDGSTAMRVGANGQYGLLAETIPVSDVDELVLSAWIRRQGEPQEAGIWVAFADEDFELIDDTPEPLLGSAQQVGDAEGTRISVIAAVPAEAVVALPTFFKNAGPGSMLVDEIVFGPVDACGDVGS